MTRADIKWLSWSILPLVIRGYYVWLLVPIIISLIFIYADSNLPGCRIIRKLFWRTIFSYAVKRIAGKSSLSSLIGYPYMIYLSFEAEAVYCSHSHFEACDLIVGKAKEIGEKMMEGLIDAARPGSIQSSINWMRENKEADAREMDRRIANLDSIIEQSEN